jgi:CRISPR-associated endonuclease/helicase Cas3
MANDEFKNGLQGAREMMTEPLLLETAFKRVNEHQLGTVGDARLVELMRKEERCLCIVNTKKHARTLFQMLKDMGSVFHLSAGMCPIHRSKVFGDPLKPEPGTIRQRLRDGEPCRVVSTQLVEAGVDLDFPVVLRSMAGIDSLVQAAGRCNREGKIPEGGRLYVFTPEEGIPAGSFRQTAQIAHMVLKEHERRILDSPTVRHYFRELYWTKEQGGGLDSQRIMSLFEAGAVTGDFPFRKVAGLYRVIPDAQMPVIVPFDEVAEGLCTELRWNTSPGALLRQLQPYTVQVYPAVLAKLLEAGYVEGLHDDSYYLLTDFGMREAYDQEIGFNIVEKDFFNPEDLMP